MENIAELLANARKKLGMTLHGVSEKTGIGFTTINAWERGASLPREKNRAIIAKFYGIPEAKLMPPASREDQVEAAQRAFLQQYDSRVVMLHKQTWAQLDALLKKRGARDVNHLLETLVSEQSGK